MLLLSEQDVERLIDPPAAIAAVLEGYRQYSAGRLLTPGRLDLRRDDPKGSVLMLAGHSQDGLFAAKSNAHVYPDATSRHRKAASLMTLWDMQDCSPLALIATTGFNNHRTASGFAAAAQLLAPPTAETLAVFGAGKIAPAVIRYLATVRPLKRVLIVGRGPERATALANAVKLWPGFSGIAVEAVQDAATAAAQADIIVTVTTSDAPVFPGRAVKPGTFIILGGANRPDAREADDDLILRAQIYADHLDGCIARAGDICIPLAAGTISRSQIVGEIGAVPSSPTKSAEGLDLTIFKSMGVIGQDLALAKQLVDKARATNVGVEFDTTDGSISHAGISTADARYPSLEYAK
jgi:ornithine cyclodeaminase